MNYVNDILLKLEIDNKILTPVTYKEGSLKIIEYGPEVKSKIQTGDIILTCNRTAIIPRTIRYYEKTPFNHVGILVRGSDILNSKYKENIMDNKITEDTICYYQSNIDIDKGLEIITPEFKKKCLETHNKHKVYSDDDEGKHYYNNGIMIDDFEKNMKFEYALAKCNMHLYSQDIDLDKGYPYEVCIRHIKYPNQTMKSTCINKMLDFIFDPNIYGREHEISKSVYVWLYMKYGYKKEPDNYTCSWLTSKIFQHAGIMKTNRDITVFSPQDFSTQPGNPSELTKNPWNNLTDDKILNNKILNDGILSNDLLDSKVIDDKILNDKIIDDGLLLNDLLDNKVIDNKIQDNNSFDNNEGFEFEPEYIIRLN